MKCRIDWSKSPHLLGEEVVKYGRELATPALERYLRAKGGEIAGRMRREAPWTDRTGQARRELRSDVEVDGAKVTLYLITGAPHGQYLELRWGGRYAIVTPTIPRAGVEVSRELKSRMAR